MTIFYLQIAVLAIFARLAGEVASRLKLPSVVGEIIAGIFLGPTIFRHFFPTAQTVLFPSQGNNHIALGAIATLGITLFLLVAGVEVDLKLVKQQHKVALPVSIGGIVCPFLLGFVPAYLYPHLLGAHPDTNPVIFALFVGAALSITSLPIMAKTLLDVGLYRTRFGMLVISSAVMDDIIGWTIAGIVFSLDNLEDIGSFTITPVLSMIGVIVVFVLLMLTVVRWLFDKVLFFVYEKFTNPSAAIGLIIGCAALGASLTQHIGIHGLFGAFMVGAVIGTSRHFRKESREAIESVVSNFLAPVYFATVGLNLNFVDNFQFIPVIFVLVAACAGKIGGCFFAARMSGISATPALAAGVAMNSRGSIEIVLGMMALQEHVITEGMFVALAIMALVTCSSSGFFLKQFGALASTAKEDDLFRVQAS